MDLRYHTPFARTGVCDARPHAEFSEYDNASLVAAGDPSRSLIYQRMLRSDAAAMPPERSAVDSEGSALIERWIRELEGCAHDDGPGR
jgi:hypothetical protein